MNQKNLVKMMFCVLVILLGLGLIFNGAIRNQVMKKATAHYQISKITAQQIEKNKKKKVTYDFKAVKPVSMSNLLSTQFTDSPYPMIGAIVVPDLKINLPIFAGVGNQLLYGAGTMKATDEMGKGNYSLAGHHVSNVIGSSGNSLLFSPLQNARENQQIFITDKSKIYVYQINQIKIVSQAEGSVIEDEKGKTEITLITCARDDHYRIVVQGNLIKTEKYNQTTSKVFEGNYTSYR